VKHNSDPIVSIQSRMSSTFQAVETLKQVLTTATDNIQSIKTELQAIENGLLGLQTNEELIQDNLLLKAQLKQVEDELAYFSTAPATSLGPKTQQASNLKNTSTLTSFRVDFSTPFQGKNWHTVESQGCWAGPKKSSSIEIPVLKPGKYRLELVICGEITKGILANTKIQINGKSLNISLTNKVLPASMMAEFDIPETLNSHKDFSELLLQFPKVVSPASLGGTDKRFLSLKAAKLTITAV